MICFVSFTSKLLMYIMAPKQMESATRFGINRITNIITDNDVNDIVAFKQYQNLASKKSRRFRSAFSTEQINYLEKEFKKFPYIGIAYRKEIAEIINISEKAVKIWFQNRRMKEKKENGINYLIDIQSKYNSALVKEQNNNYIEQNGNIKNISQVIKNDYSNGIINDVINKNCQKKPQRYESANISGSDNNSDVLVTKSDKFTNLSPRIHIKTTIPSKSTTTKGNMCASNEKQNITSNYFDNKTRVHLTSQHLKDVPQDLSSKKDTAQKPISSNQHSVSVDLNPEQKYVCMYNICTTSLPIGTAVTTGIPVQTGPAVSRGNVIWKPIDSIPAPDMPPVGMARSNEIPFNNQNNTRNCNCNCHNPSQCHSAIAGFNQDPRIHPQYLLAIPLSSTCNQL